MEKTKETQDFTEITIPTLLAEKIKKRILGTQFSSISAYVTYVLTEVISDSESEENEQFNKEDDERVKARLRSLGYLD